MCSHYLPLTLPDGSGLQTVFVAVAKQVERTTTFRTAIAAARRACKDMQFKQLQDKKSQLTGDELFYVKFLYTWTLEELFKRRHGRGGVRVCQPIPPLGIAYVGTPLIPPQQIDQLPDRIFVQQKWSKQQTVLELFTSKTGSSNVYSRTVEAVPKFRIVTAGKSNRCVVKEITWNGMMFPLTRSEGRGTGRARQNQEQQQAEDSSGSSSSDDDNEGSSDDDDKSSSSDDEDDEQEEEENENNSGSNSSSQHETRIVRRGGRYPLRRTTTRTDAAEGSNGKGGDGSSSRPADSDSESDDSRDEEQEGDELEDATAPGARAVPPPGAADARGTVPQQIVLAQQQQPQPDRNVQQQLQAMQQQFQVMQQQMGQVQDQIQLLVAAAQQRQSQQGQQKPGLQDPEGNGVPEVQRHRRPRAHEVTPDGNNQQQKRRRLDGDFDGLCRHHPTDGADAASTMTEPSYEEVRDWVVTVVSDDKARTYLEEMTDADADTCDGKEKHVTRRDGNRYEIVLEYHRCGELDHLLIRHKPCIKWLQDIGKSVEWVRHRLLQELDGHVLHDPNLDSVQRKEMTTPDNRKAKYGRLSATLVVSYGTAPVQDWRMDALHPHFQGILLLTIGHPTDVAPVQNVLRMGPNALQVEDVVHMLCYPNVVSRKAKADMVQAIRGVPDAVDLVTQYGWLLASDEDIQKAHDDAMKSVPGQGNKVRGYMGFPGSMLHREPAHDGTRVLVVGTYGPPSSSKANHIAFQQQHTATSVFEQLSDLIVPRMRTTEAKKAFQEAGKRLGQGTHKVEVGGKKNFFQYWFGY